MYHNITNNYFRFNIEAKELCKMLENDTKKICCSDIGYYGTPINDLTREELLEAFLELAQTIVNCSSNDNQRKAIFTINQDQKEVKNG
jgi:hypothetical protein